MQLKKTCDQEKLPYFIMIIRNVNIQIETLFILRNQ